MIYLWITVFSFLGAAICALIYRDLKQAYDKIDYLLVREDMEIEKAFLAGIDYARKNDD